MLLAFLNWAHMLAGVYSKSFFKIESLFLSYLYFGAEEEIPNKPFQEDKSNFNPREMVVSRGMMPV
jgi:hypothetical protein